MLRIIGLAPGQHDSTLTEGRENIESARKPRDGAETAPRRTAGRIAVAQAGIDILDARALVDGYQLELRTRSVVEHLHQDLSPSGVTHYIRCQFRRDDTNPARAHLVEHVTVREPLRTPPAFPDITVVRHRYPRLRSEDDSTRHFHRVTITRVPTPTVEFSSNSFTRRRAPVRPKPSPVPEVH